MTSIFRSLVARALGADPATLPEGDLPLERFGQRHGAFLAHEEGTAERHPDAWTWAVLQELVASDPLLALAAIRATLAACDTPAQIARLAAGPLEDLIVTRGPEVAAALADAPGQRLLYALTGVWLDEAPAMVRARIEALRKGVPALDDGAPLP